MVGKMFKPHDAESEKSLPTRPWSRLDFCCRVALRAGKAITTHK